MVNRNRPLFSWSDVERRPELERLEMVLEALPDEDLLRALEPGGRASGGDGDGTTIRSGRCGELWWRGSSSSMSRWSRCCENWGAIRRCWMCAGLIRWVGGVGRRGQAFRVRKGAEGRWGAIDLELLAVSQCGGQALEEKQGRIAAMMGQLREQLMEEVEDFGEHLGYDGKAIESHSTGQENRKTGKTSDPEADWGKHETGGKDRRTGKLWRKVKTWFGYRVHLIADIRYEIPVACTVTRASRSEVKQLEAMTEALFEETPELAKQCQDFSADRGLDSGPLKESLWDDYGIRPLIEPRELWKEEKKEPGYDPGEAITRPLYPDRADSIVHTEKGHVLPLS